MNPSRRRFSLLALISLVMMTLQGCVFCSFLEYGDQCCGACGTLCSQTCLPLCVDTAFGRGPLNSSGQFLPATAEVPVGERTDAPAAVAY